MNKLGKVFLIAGLVVLMCSPAVALSQADRPVKESGCTTSGAPVIDGDLDEAFWDTAHWEQIPYIWPEDGTVMQAQDLSLGIGHDLNHLYIAVVEYWPENEVFAEDIPIYSQFSFIFEDEYPLWTWNQEHPSLWSDEGQFWFFAPLYDGQAECRYIGRLGGVQTGMPNSCKSDLVSPAPGVEYAFQAQVNGGARGVHEAAIDLTVSPLNVDVQQGPCFTAVFQSWPPTRAIRPGSADEAFASFLGDAGALADGPVAVWPEDFWDNCPRAGDWTTCSECIEFHGKICFAECAVETTEEFVPEPATLLLLGSGLLGLGGYTGLRKRRS